MNRQISHEEVKKHADQKSSWIIIHNDVYDVTKFLDEHPGGADTLLEYAGKDGTQAFEDVGHSKDAREIMKKYKIGTLPPGEQVPTKKKKGLKCCVPSQVDAESKRSEVGGSGGGSRHSNSAGSIPMLPGPGGGAAKDVCGHCRAPRGPGPCGVCASAGPKSPQEPRIQRRIKSIVVPPDRGPHTPDIEESQGGGFVPRLNRKFIVLPASRDFGRGSGGGSRNSLRGRLSGGSSGPNLRNLKTGSGHCSHCASVIKTNADAASKTDTKSDSAKPILVTRESGSSRLKWALIALAGAVLLGIAYKKFKA